MNLLCRLAVVTACCFAAWWSGRMAWADWIGASEAPDGASRAARMEPGDARLVAIDALVRSDNGDPSPAIDNDLQRALQLNPRDSAVLMTLGLRAEFRGDKAAAESYLLRAASVDRQFKPAWALANYYVRTGQPEKMFPLAERCLRLDPLGFDSAPVFDLLWNATSDGNRILRLVPGRRPRLIEYFSYLVRTQRLDAAVSVWPAALQAADPPKPGDTGSLTPFCGLLVAAGRTEDSVRAWNNLVARGFIHSGPLAPAKGESIADPLFAFTGSEGTFAWQLGTAADLFIRNLSPSLQFEIDGREPETMELLRVSAPVLPGRDYKLLWRTDASRLAAPHDPGFSFRIRQGADVAETQCPLLVAGSGCSFHADSAVKLLQLALVYSRAPGTVRARGALRLLKTSLEFAS